MRRCSRTILSICQKINSCSQRQLPLTATTITTRRTCSSSYSRLATVSTTSVQSFRRYASAHGTFIAECWNCKKTTELKNCMICSGCGQLQDVDGNINYFDLLNLPQTYELEMNVLTTRFRHLQTLVHPDKFSNKSAREQTNSSDWSSLINKAYKTLATPLERGQYMLRLHGEPMTDDNVALDKGFLMDIMERNEQIEDTASSETLQQLKDEVDAELKVLTMDLGAQFNSKSLENAKVILIQMTYLINLQQSIKKKNMEITIKTGK